MSEGKTLRERIELDNRFSIAGQRDGLFQVTSHVNQVTYTVDTHTMEVTFETLYNHWRASKGGDASMGGWTALYGVLKVNGSRIPNLALVTE